MQSWDSAAVWLQSSDLHKWGVTALFHSTSWSGDLASIVHRETRCPRDVAHQCVVSAGASMPSELIITSLRAGRDLVQSHLLLKWVESDLRGCLGSSNEKKKNETRIRSEVSLQHPLNYSSLFSSLWGWWVALTC